MVAKCSSRTTTGKAGVLARTGNTPCGGNAFITDLTERKRGRRMPAAGPDQARKRGSLRGHSAGNTSAKLETNETANEGCQVLRRDPTTDGETAYGRQAFVATKHSSQKTATGGTNTKVMLGNLRLHQMMVENP